MSSTCRDVAQRRLDRGGQCAAQGQFVLLEQLGDDLVLALEMVVQIAGADIQFVGDIDGGGVAFAFGIEQRQAGYQDAVPRFHRFVCSGGYTQLLLVRALLLAQLSRQSAWPGFGRGFLASSCLAAGRFFARCRLFRGAFLLGARAGAGRLEDALFSQRRGQFAELIGHAIDLFVQGEQVFTPGGTLQVKVFPHPAYSLLDRTASRLTGM